MIERIEVDIMKDWGMKNSDNPLVSVQCITYNHENYIAQALDGFLMQKTNFPFEVIVHDDASSDRTADIVREYERKYPKIIKAIYQTENQYSKRDGSIRRIMNEACKGKYLAFCEGDDYWIDENKLQMQVDFLEKNPEYSAYFSNVEGIDADGRLFDYVYKVFPLYKTQSILKEDTHYYSLIGQLATCMVRSDLYLKEVVKAKVRANGDLLLSAIVRAKGNVYYSEKQLARYRITFTGDSWTARTYQKDLAVFYYMVHKELLDFSENILKKKYHDGHYKLAKIILLKAIVFIKKHNKDDFKELIELLSMYEHKIMFPIHCLIILFGKLLKFDKFRKKLK